MLNIQEIVSIWKREKKVLLRINEYVLETKSPTTIFALERKFCDFSFIQV